MNLRTLAEQDLGAILEDDFTGFGWPITVTAPDLTVQPLVGFSNDIAQVIDPETGQAISGRLASVALRISSLTVAFPTQGMPKGIADAKSKPWQVQFDDINGSSHTFKVSQSNPDRALGLLSLILEAYQ